MFCSNCGNKLADDDAFCGNCGQPVTKEEVTESSVTAAEPLVTAAEPLVTAAESSVTAAEPLVTAAESSVTAAEPLVTAAESSVTAAATAGEASVSDVGASGNACEKQSDPDSSDKKPVKKSKYKWNVDMGACMIVLAVLYSVRGWFYVFGEPYWIFTLNTKEYLYRYWSYLEISDRIYGIACMLLVFVCVFTGIALLKKEKVAPKALFTCHVLCFLVGLAYMIIINYVISYRGLSFSYINDVGMRVIVNGDRELEAIKRTTLDMTQYYAFFWHVPMFFLNLHFAKKCKDLFVN